jgi:protein O-GlcNAc transferase
LTAQPNCSARDLLSAWQRSVSQAVRADRLRSTGKLARSLVAYSQALDSYPDFPEALNNLGLALRSLGRLDEALQCFERALRINPGLTPAQSNLLLMLLYSPNVAPEVIADAHRQWGNQFSDVLRPQRPGSTRRQLRIGYVSTGFKQNAERFFTEPILRHHDRRRFEIYCYANVSDPDRWTRRFRRLADHWRDILSLSDEQAAHRIRRDGIAILVDLTGHMADSRLSIFAKRPAPIQVSFPTYPATSGLKSADFRISDAYADPVGMTEHLHTEKLVRLPHIYVPYRPPEEAPEVNELPAVQRSFVTLGSLQRRPKISGPMLELWATILKRVPGARLLFHYNYNVSATVAPEIRNPILQVLARNGVDSTRVRFVGGLPHRLHLELYHEIDISLDTFPYNGMTTTCDSLWMGVPVVTLAGRSHITRTSGSFLGALGLTDWIAESPRDYVRIAVSMARNTTALAALRIGLRDRMRKSAVCDGAGYTRALERAYLEMWRNLKASNRE